MQNWLMPSKQATSSPEKEGQTLPDRSSPTASTARHAEIGSKSNNVADAGAHTGSSVCSDVVNRDATAECDSRQVPAHGKTGDSSKNSNSSGSKSQTNSPKTHTMKTFFRPKEPSIGHDARNRVNATADIHARPEDITRDSHNYAPQDTTFCHASIQDCRAGNSHAPAQRHPTMCLDSTGGTISPHDVEGGVNCADLQRSDHQDSLQAHREIHDVKPAVVKVGPISNNVIEISSSPTKPDTMPAETKHAHAAVATANEELLHNTSFPVQVHVPAGQSHKHKLESESTQDTSERGNVRKFPRLSMTTACEYFPAEQGPANGTLLAGKK
jgi:hypothetical protein